MSRYEAFLDKASNEYIYHDRFLKVRTAVLKDMEKRHFFDAKGVYGEGGFGVLSEKSMHAVLKRFAEPDDNYHEVAIEGFFADICREGKITEIQTKRLANLKKKLRVFLVNHTVTVIHPVAYNKWRGYSDCAHERPKNFRLSPHHRSEYEAFDELFGIKEFLKHPNFKLHLYIMDVEEILVKQRNTKGRRKARSGYEHFENIPLGIRKIIEFNCVNDYMQIVPEIEGEFTSRDFAESALCSVSTASMVLNILNHIGVVRRIGRKGHAYLYETVY